MAELRRIAPEGDDDVMLEQEQYLKIFTPDGIDDAFYACDPMLLKLK